MADVFEGALEPEPELHGWARRTVAAWRLVADCRDSWSGALDWRRVEHVLGLYHVRLTPLLHTFLRVLSGVIAEARREAEGVAGD